MSLLAPWYLLGILAVAVPVWLHLMWSRPKQRQQFSALRFLRATRIPFKRKRRLDAWPLLLLRVLLIALICLAFSRPFFDKGLPPPLGLNERTQRIILLDRSASMRGTLWREAQAAALREINRTALGDNTGLIAFAKRADRIVEFADEPVGSDVALRDRVGMMSDRLRTLAPTWETTRLAAALNEALAMLGEAKPEQFETRVDALRPGPSSVRREIVIISDFQESTDFSDWAENKLIEERIGLRMITLQPERPYNLAVQGVDFSEQEQGSESALVRVSGFGEGTGDFSGADGLLTNEAGRSLAMFALENRSNILVSVPLGSTGAMAIRVAETNSREFDDTVYFAPQSDEPLRVVYVSDEVPGDTSRGGFYLRKAISAWDRTQIEFQEIAPDADRLQDELVMADWVIASTEMDEDSEGFLKRRVELGMPMLLFLQSEGMENTVASFLDISGEASSSLSLSTVRSGTGERYAEIDFDAPFFKPFEAQPYQNFADIRVTRYQRLLGDFFETAQPDVLARYRSGEVAWFEKNLGEGALWVSTTSLDRSDSNWVLSPRFVPFVHGALEAVKNQRSLRSQYQVGEVIAAYRLAGRTVIGPGGDALVSGEGQDLYLSEPGIYRIREKGGALQEFAVNIDPRESRVRPLSPDELAALGLENRQYEQVAAPDRNTGDAANPVSTENQADQIEESQKLWKLVMLVVLLLLFVETFWSTFLGSRSTPDVSPSYPS